MIKLNIENIKRYYARLIGLANKAITKNDVDKTSFHLSNAAMLAYNFNFIYRDDALEDIIRKISAIVLNDKCIDFKPTSKIVFYDSFSLDNRGLTQQYIRGLMACDCEFLYIYENRDPAQCIHIDQELKSYKKVQTYELPPNYTTTQKIEALYQIISDYAPSKAFLHLTPWPVEILAVFAALPQVTTYNVNLTDHAYWAGVSIINYNIEFRNYGATVSVQKRGLRQEQLLILPYYPITSSSAEFKGFPDIVKDKVVIFSGGSLYKVYGEQGEFFKIVKRLLGENPNVVLLFAGSGNKTKFTEFIQRNNFQSRIALIGNRTDIDQVFKNADIYLGTYPFGGGLMSQFAAVNGLPILAYTDPKYAINYIEGIVCHNYELMLTHENERDFFAHAHQLCQDDSFRKEIGAEIKKCVITPDQFNKEFAQLLKTNTTNRQMTTINIDYEAFSDLYFEVENEFQPQIQLSLLSKYKLQSILLFPKLTIKAIPTALKKIKQRLLHTR